MEKNKKSDGSGAKKKLEWRTERRKVNDLIPYSGNPRILSDLQREGLVRSFKKFGLVEIPACNADGTLCAGHQRVKVLQLLGRGEEEIDVRIPSRQLSDAEFRDYLLTSNRSGASWDWEKLAADFDLGELLVAGFDATDLSHLIDDNLDVDDTGWDPEAELPEAEKTAIKPGDYFALGQNRLLCGDATDPAVIKRLMAGMKADMVNTDTPFNIGLSYDRPFGSKKRYGGTTDDTKTEADYRQFVKTIIANALSASKPDAHIMFWCDECWVWLLQTVYRELGIDVRRLCIWLKNNQSATPKIAFNKITEYCLYGTVGKPYLSDKIKNLNEILNKEVGSGNRLSDDILDLFNIWMVKRLAGTEYEHPTQKPPRLHEKALRRCTKPGDIILDLTAGSGSLLHAAHSLKRIAYCCELEPVFCQLIINLFTKHFNEKVTKLN